MLFNQEGRVSSVSLSWQDRIPSEPRYLVSLSSITCSQSRIQRIPSFLLRLITSIPKLHYKRSNQRHNIQINIISVFKNQQQRREHMCYEHIASNQKLLIIMSENSALKQHYLSSVLPFGTHTQPQQFTKSKQFYQPDEFIWNNPHRTSKPMYKFYHRYNDRYKRQIEPKIKARQEEDRKNQERQRIRKLSDQRNETRQRFFHQKKSRENIQIISKSRRNYSNIILSYDHQQQSKKKHSHLIERPKQNHTIEASYQKSVDVFDKNVKKMSELIESQHKVKHQTIRSQFLRRKKLNERKKLCK